MVKEDIIVIYFSNEYCIIRNKQVENIEDIKGLPREEVTYYGKPPPACSEIFKIKKNMTEEELSKIFVKLDLEITNFKNINPFSKMKFISY
eukprot:snap_masked-scaffold_55-processed-gene-1.42-mRNA-1 protein AED:1.00 eAED:1.00 QI:0/-1/0/0/-1/1/1/0/90